MGRHEGDIHQTLAEFYGEVIPATAWLLEHHLTAGRIPLRMPDGQVRVVNLEQAAAEFGGDLTESRRYLHHLHAIGTLVVEEDGTVQLPPRVADCPGDAIAAPTVPIVTNPTAATAETGFYEQIGCGPCPPAFGRISNAAARCRPGRR